MVPSFVHELDVQIDTPHWGKIKLDLCYGGIFYALVDVGQISPAIEKANAAFARPGRHGPEGSDQSHHSCGPSGNPGNLRVSPMSMFGMSMPMAPIRTCTTMWPGRVDRSPCGTGNFANLATLHARGKVKVGDVFKSRSIVGSEFEVGLQAVTEVAGKPAIIPTITGRGFTFGLSLRGDRSA